MGLKNESNHIEINRLYDAPLKAVWAAWTEPKQLAHWWGPRGFGLTTNTHELKLKGYWNFAMHGEDGVNYPNTIKFLEIETHSRLVYEHGANLGETPMFRVTVTFTELKGKTNMRMVMEFSTPEAAKQARQSIKQFSGLSTWDRLGEYLVSSIANKEQFIINRTFDAPIDVLFSMWTDPKHLARWCAPEGTDMKFIRSDIRLGGSSLSCTKGADGSISHDKSNYLEFERPHRLVYTQQSCDEHGVVVRMAPNWPETMLTTVLFAAENENQTRVTIVWEPIGNVLAQEIEMFTNARSGMTHGWSGTLDKLEQHLP